MNKHHGIGRLLIGAGIVITIVMATADIFATAARIGISQYQGFGPLQTSGVIIGVVLLVVGVVLARRKEQDNNEGEIV